MRKRVSRHLITPQVSAAPIMYSVPVMNGTGAGCGCTRQNPADPASIALYAAMGIGGAFVLYLAVQKYKVDLEHKRAQIRAMDEGRVDNLSISQADVDATGYGFSFN